MPRNGSGSYSLPSGNPFVPSTVISSTTMNNTMSDLGTAITQSIAYDGQTTPVANLPMATFRHTNVGNAASRTDYAAAGQVQDGSLVYLTGVAGTDTITATIVPAFTSYATGQSFRFISAGANTTTTPTLNINGLGAKSLKKNGNIALQAGDIPAGAVVHVTYDGTNFQLSTIQKGSFLGVQVFNVAGASVYTPTPGTGSVVVEVVGGGGGGGGTQATGAGQNAGAAGGGSGGYSIGRITSAFSGVTVTVGAAGAANLGAAGGNGGASSFGTLIVCNGGAGGQAGTPSATGTIVFLGGGAGGSTPTPGNIAAFNGQYGALGICGTNQTSGIGGSGAAGRYAGSTAIGFNSSGNFGLGYGAGGGGAGATASSGALNGSIGGSGLVVVWEYA